MEGRRLRRRTRRYARRGDHNRRLRRHNKRLRQEEAGRGDSGNRARKAARGRHGISYFNQQAHRERDYRKGRLIMTMAVKNVAILGANKEGLSLLPVLLKDPSTRLAMIADPNPDAMLFKLGELGYRLSPRFHTHVTNDLEDLKKITGLNVIINAIPGPVTEKIMAEPEFNGMEKLSPLSAKLLWGVRVAATGEAGKK